MGQVLDTRILKTEGYRFRTGWFGKQILQVCDTCQTWDTNTGGNDGPPFEQWRDATEHETRNAIVI